MKKLHDKLDDIFDEIVYQVDNDHMHKRFLAAISYTIVTCTVLALIYMTFLLLVLGSRAVWSPQ